MSDSIDGVRIWLSGSISDDASDKERQRIVEFLRALGKEVYARRGRLVHGSHPTIRDTLVVAAEAFKDTPNGSGLVLVVSRYYSKKPSESKVNLERWNAASAERVIETPEAQGDNDHEIKTKSLEILRNTLLEQCNVIIAVGGKWWDVAKGNAGVPEEIKLAAGQHLPLFLLGGLGGATRDYLASKPELLKSCKNGLTAEQNLELAGVKDPAELAQRVVDQISQLPVRYRNRNAGRPFRILCLDGGGIRGAYTAAIVAYFERAIPDCRVVNHFDLIAGTSTGGILAIGLGLGLSAEEMLKFYEDHGATIFPTENEFDRLWHSFRHWFGSKFDQNILKATLKEAYDKAPQGGTSLDNSLCRLLIPSYNTKIDRPVVFRTPHGPFTVTDAGRNPVEVALSTAAAPTYFDPVAAEGVVAKIEAADGGVWANNPSMVALSEAVEHLGIPLERIDMLSLGTTYSVAIAGQPFLLDKNIIGKVVGLGAGHLAGIAAKLFWQDAPIRGKIGWVANIAEFLMKTQAQTVDHVCLGLRGDRGFLRIDDPFKPTELDDVKAIGPLASLGEDAAKKHLREVRARFLNGVPADAWTLS